MKKLLALIIVPIMTISILSGCLKKKEYTPSDVEKTFATFMDKHISSGSNKVFKYNTNTYNSPSDEPKQIDSENALYEKVMYITFDNQQLQNAVSTKDISIDGGLSDLYFQIKSVYQKILSLSYNYYANWSYNFYDKAKGIVPSEELGVLNDKIRDVSYETDKFLGLKNTFESKIVNINSLILTTEIKTFNHAYIGLIDKSLDMINYFEYLHSKYMYSNKFYTMEYTKRLVDETVLKIANSFYLDMVKAFTISNKVEISHLFLDSSMNNAGNLFHTDMWFNILKVEDGIDALFKSELNGILSDNNSIEYALVSGVKTSEEGEGVTQQVYNEMKSRVDLLILLNRIFDQDFEIYKSIFNSFSIADLQEFNSFRGLSLTTSANFDKDNLPLKALNNYEIMTQFGVNKLPNLYYGLTNLMIL